MCDVISACESGGHMCSICKKAVVENLMAQTFRLFIVKQVCSGSACVWSIRIFGSKLNWIWACSQMFILTGRKGIHKKKKNGQLDRRNPTLEAKIQLLTWQK